MRRLGVWLGMLFALIGAAAGTMLAHEVCGPLVAESGLGLAGYALLALLTALGALLGAVPGLVTALAFAWKGRRRRKE